jgi:hypothetical protein
MVSAVRFLSDIFIGRLYRVNEIPEDAGNRLYRPRDRPGSQTELSIVAARYRVFDVDFLKVPV